MVEFTFERVVSSLGLCISLAAFGVSIASSIETGASANRTAEIAMQGQKRSEKEFSLRLFADTRPWISIKPIINGVHLSYNTMDYLDVDCELENHGRSAGIDIVITSEAATTDLEDVKKTCKEADAKSESDFHLGQTLLPSEKVTNPQLVQIEQNASYGQLRITGCVTYRTTIDDKSHQTRFSYDIDPQKNMDDKSAYQIIKNIIVKPATFTSFLTAD